MERRAWAWGFRSAQRVAISRLGEPVDPLAKGFPSALRRGFADCGNRSGDAPAQRVRQTVPEVMPDYTAFFPAANHRAAASALSWGTVLNAIAALGAAL